MIAPAVTIVDAWNWFDISGFKRWLTWKAELEAKENSFAPENVIPLPVPNEQNAATAKSELFTPLLKNPQQNSPTFKKPFTRELASRQIARLGQMSGGDFLGRGSSEKRSTPADTLLNALKPFETDLNLLATAMEQPYSRFDIRCEDVFMALMPHLSFLKQASPL